jgi:hypothetical protein
MKNAVFWDVAPCSFCVNRCFGESYRLHLQSRRICKWGTNVSKIALLGKPLKLSSTPTIWTEMLFSQQVMEASHLLTQETRHQIYKATQVHTRSAVWSWDYWVNAPSEQYLVSHPDRILTQLWPPTCSTLSLPSPHYWFPTWPSFPPCPYIAEHFNWQLSLQLLAHTGSSLAVSSTLKMEAIRSSETLVHTKTTRRHIPENGILQLIGGL